MKKLILVCLIIGGLCIGCSNNEVTALKAKLNRLESDLNQYTNQDTEDDLEEYQIELDAFQAELTATNTKIDQLQEQIKRNTETLNQLKANLSESIDVIDLTKLSESELDVYIQFSLEYRPEVLEDIQPLTIMKYYLYANKIRDYETAYELYTKNLELVMWTKEEDQDISEDHRMTDFEVFTDVYDVTMNYVDDDQSEVYIAWQSLNGYTDEQGVWTYDFHLIKEDNIWRVVYMPMQ